MPECEMASHLPCSHRFVLEEGDDRESILKPYRLMMGISAERTDDLSLSRIL